MHEVYSKLMGFCFSDFVTDGITDLKLYTISDSKDEVIIHCDGKFYGDSTGDGACVQEPIRLYNEFFYNITYDYCWGFYDYDE